MESKAKETMGVKEAKPEARRFDEDFLYDFKLPTKEELPFVPLLGPHGFPLSEGWVPLFYFLSSLLSES